MPNLSLMALSTGTMALVVQLAAVTILSSSVRSPLLMPYTMFLSEPLPGAVSSTRDTPGLCRCSDRPASSRQEPVLSITMALWMPWAV